MTLEELRKVEQVVFSCKLDILKLREVRDVEVSVPVHADLRFCIEVKVDADLIEVVVADTAIVLNQLQKLFFESTLQRAHINLHVVRLFLLSL